MRTVVKFTRNLMNEPPFGAGSKAIRSWVEQQVTAGRPKGRLYLTLLHGPIPDDLSELEAISAARDSLGEILVGRNLDGIQAEKAGREEQAVRLYEANVTEQFDGSHPYERLRIIYSRQGRYLDAIRVCEAYLLCVSEDPRYRRWIEKYRLKCAGSATPSAGA